MFQLLRALAHLEEKREGTASRPMRQRRLRPFEKSFALVEKVCRVHISSRHFGLISGGFFLVDRRKKRLSKVETLKTAIEYIRHLEDVLSQKNVKVDPRSDFMSTLGVDDDSDSGH
jgi:Helix-loop-helix DNA-binding domain